jgi:outer membrane protein assembly factor BamB
MRTNIRRWTLMAALGALTAMPHPAAAAVKKKKAPAPRKPAVTRKAPAKKTTAPTTARTAATTTVAATASTAISPGGNWPMFRGNPKHSAYSPTTVTLPLTAAWTWKGDAVAVVSSPSIVDGTVYIGTRDDTSGTKGSLLALDLQTGKLKWRYNKSDVSHTNMTHTAKEQAKLSANQDPTAVSWVDSSPAVVNDRVYVMSRDGALHALTTSGELKWRLKTGGLDMSSPTVVDGTVYIGSGYPNKDFWAVDAVGGVVKWRVNSGLPDPTAKRQGQYVYSSPAFADDTVYTAANDGGFYALDPKTGKLKWRFETQGGVYFHSPTVAGDFLIGAPGDYDTAVYAINRATGDIGWKYNSGLQHSYVSSPAYDGSTVYIGIGEPDQEIVALDGKTGKEQWKYVTGYATQNSYTSSPAVTNNVILVGAAQANRKDPESGRLIALDKTTGKVLWEDALPKPVLSSPSVADGYVVVGDMDGTVRAYKFGS